MIKNTFKNIFVVALMAAMPIFSFAQHKPNWQNLDLKTDSSFGISTEKAYKELLKGKKSTPVLVAVLDGGVDLNHEDLKRVIWNNTKEIAGNGIDDDKNGYIDDIHGWNFLGGKDGKSVEFENLELTRLVRRDEARFAGINAGNVPAADKAAFETFIKNRTELETRLITAKSDLQGTIGFKYYLDQVVVKMGKPNPVIADVEAFKPVSQQEDGIKNALLDVLKDMDYKTFYETQIIAGYKQAYDMVYYNLNIDYNPRDIVGDDPNNSKEKFYGNNDIKGPDALHGSHVAGIIAADRTNNIGIKGVADNVLIIGVRNTPNGDERDKDVA
ncbi:MAG: peptidase S8, partial [Pedobacter sp.]